MTPQVFFQEETNEAACYVLQRVADPERAGHFTLEQRIRYADPDEPRWRFVVPAADSGFETDLASIPSVATWLVPKDGTHTPAAILHDALVYEPGKPRTYEGTSIDREEADLVFREAMRYLEVPALRRWMMWAAVSLATLMTPGEGRRHWYWRVLIPVVVTALLVVGVVSVLDLVDLHRVRVPLVGWLVPTELPWMGERAALAELWRGLAAAAIAAAVSSVLWWRRWRVGLTAVLVVIPFAFPLVVASLAYLGYYAVELALYGALKLRRARRPAAGDTPVAPRVLMRRP